MKRCSLRSSSRLWQTSVAQKTIGWFFDSSRLKGALEMPLLFGLPYPPWSGNPLAQVNGVFYLARECLTLQIRLTSQPFCEKLYSSGLLTTAVMLVSKLAHVSRSSSQFLYHSLSIKQNTAWRRFRGSSHLFLIVSHKIFNVFLINAARDVRFFFFQSCTQKLAKLVGESGWRC